MAQFEMIKYYSNSYPQNIPLNIEERPCNFDTMWHFNEMEYSLHTEYSFTRRDFKNPYIIKHEALMSSHVNKIPMLWYNDDWAKEFAEFIIEFLSKKRTPKYIEIHPPFYDYTPKLELFIRRYAIFEDIIKNAFPQTIILLENRCGTSYRGSKFIISKAEDIINLAEEIEKTKLGLMITLDVPQLYSAHEITTKNKEKLWGVLADLKCIRKK